MAPLSLRLLSRLPSERKLHGGLSMQWRQQFSAPLHAQRLHAGARCEAGEADGDPLALLSSLRAARAAQRKRKKERRKAAKAAAASATAPVSGGAAGPDPGSGDASVSAPAPAPEPTVARTPPVPSTVGLQMEGGSDVTSVSSYRTLARASSHPSERSNPYPQAANISRRSHHTGNRGRVGGR